MKQVEDNISLFVENHFPNFYKEYGNTFIEFVKEYYTWSQQTNNSLYFSRNLLEHRDIDSTLDDFLYHYKIKYLNGMPVNIVADRFNVKHYGDFYKSKGTERGVDLLLKRTFDAGDVEIYIPNKDIIKASDGEWYVPVYLEVSQSVKNKSFIGKSITGSSSRATAIVEGIGNKVVAGKSIDILFISNVLGSFEFDELLTSDGSLDNSPKVVGSLNQITINDPGRDFVVGDVVNILSSSRGKQGKARIDSVESSTGKITFTLLDGGTGYRLAANVAVAEKMLRFTNQTFSSVYVQNFLPGEIIYQPLANIEFISSNTNFSIADLITAANSTQNVATGRIVGKSQGTISGTATANSTSNTVTGTNTLFSIQLSNNSFIKFQSNDSVFQVSSITSNNTLTLTTFGPNVTSNNMFQPNGSFMVIVNSGNWNDADRIQGSQALISALTNVTASGTVLKANNDSVGLVNVVNQFTANQYNYIYGLTSNVYANVSIVGTGTGATFNIGSLTEEETVFLNTDQLKSNNSIILLNIDGTVTCNTTNSLVTGVSTLFTTDLYEGAYIKIGSNTTVFQVNTISNNTILNLTTNASSATSNTVVLTSGPYLTIPLDARKYGLPLNREANLQNIINSALTKSFFEIGTIASLSSINPGSDYNINPFVVLNDEFISNFNRRNLNISISNTVGTFLVDEEITQDFSTPSFTLQTSGTTGSLSLGETLTQTINSTTNGYGSVASSNSTISVINVSNLSNSTFGNSFVNSTLSSVLTGTVSSNTTNNQITGVATLFSSELANGNFIKFSSNSSIFKIDSITNNTFMTLTTNSALIVSNSIFKASNVATSITSNNFLFVNNAITNTQISISRGSIITATSTNLSVKRKTFNQSFTSNVSITGSTSGAVASVGRVSQISGSLLMGNNAIVNSFAGIVNGSISTLSVIDSGFLYEDGEELTLSKADNAFVATGYAKLLNQGVGEGYFLSNRGFLNSDKYIHDGEFYQFFSYQVSSGIPLEKYENALKTIMHVAGTKLFGKVLKTSNVNLTIKTSGIETSI